ncbi:MAG TPA: hypothetical protein VFW71_08780 [Actinomycetota bacterium]|nr:hypothetical protein [Actinomycetota bacterium]
MLALVGLTGAPPASAQVQAATAAFSGYAAGATVHVNALNSGSSNVVELDQAYGGAAVNSKGLNAEVDSQIDTVVQAADPGKMSGAQGSGVELGLGNKTPVANPQLILDQKATADAPPNSTQDHKISLNGALNPIVDATLLEGRATANWDTSGCILGEPVAQGFGHAANAQAVGSGTTTPVVNAPGDLTDTSELDFVPQTDAAGNVAGNSVGLMASDTQTFAPISLLGGLITVTVIGPIYLKAVATGIAGDAYVLHNTGGAPLVTVQTAAQTTALTLSADQLFGANGINLPLLGLVNIQLGGPPTVQAAADGTSVTANWNLISLSVGGAVATLLQAHNVADLAVAHMEASATVPAGGLICQVDVSKTAQPATVHPGDHFTYTITVTNPHACTLTGVKVVDTLTTTGNVRYTIDGANPAQNAKTGSTLTWNDIGPLAPGQTKQLVVNMTLSSGSGGGTLTETANVTASCAIGNAQGTSTVNVPAIGSASITGPAVNSANGAVLPVTGGLTGRYYAVALLILLGAAAFGWRGLKVLFDSGR